MEFGNENSEAIEITPEIAEAFGSMFLDLAKPVEKPPKITEPEEPKNPKHFDSAEDLEKIVNKISGPSDNEKIVSFQVTESDNDPERKNITLGIAYNDAENPHSVAQASVNRGVMTVHDLPLPSHPETAIDYPAVTKNSDTLLSALVETAERTGCREVIIPAAEENRVTENLRERNKEEAKRSGWEVAVGNYIKGLFTDTARQTTEAIFDNPAENRGFKYDKDNSVWRLKLKD
jgi:hypothetical protein